MKVLVAGGAGNIAALEYMLKNETNYDIFNLGRTEDVTVLELISAHEDVCKSSVPLKFTKRRSGDIRESWASADKVKKLLSWKSEFNLNRIC